MVIGELRAMRGGIECECECGSMMKVSGGLGVGFETGAVVWFGIKHFSM
jgi:hypothetical protein